jgi:oligosaccharide repeat unit polymerase
MLETLICATGLFCVISLGIAWARYKDVFHPLVIVTPMFAFFYVYMPSRLVADGSLYSYASEDQAAFYQLIVLLALAAFSAGCFKGSSDVHVRSISTFQASYDRKKLQNGAYLLGTIGLGCWLQCMGNTGGIANAFSEANARGWSEFGFVREAMYLMIVAQLLLLSPQGFDLRNKTWWAAVVLFTLPYVLQGLLGAQRGPTFLITATLAISWFLGRRSRPPLLLVLGGGIALGFLMLFLMTNRSQIHLGSDFEVKTDVSDFFAASPANEYVFGVGAVATTRQTGQFYWGKRYLAQILVRPIPRQLWATKYEDFGIAEIERNAGAGVDGMSTVMGWEAMTGAAATMVADVWIEFSWLCIPFLGVLGWIYGYIWRRAIWQGDQWTTILTIVMLLSVYFISQSGEAVIFRMLILTVPSSLVWHRARRSVVDSHAALAR